MNKFLPLLALLFMTLIWSYNWTIMKSVLQYIGALEFTAMRSIAGALILFVVLVATRRPIAPPPLLPTLAVGILQTAGMTSLSQFALLSGGVGTTAVLTYSMPFWVIIFAAIFLKERTSGLQKLAFIIAAFGFICIIRPWEANSSLLSFILATMSGVTWALASVIFKKLYNRGTIELLNFTTWQMFLGALVLIVLAIATHSKPIILNDDVFRALAYNAFLSTALAWALWLYILKALPAGIAGLSTLMVPIVSIFFAWLRLGEIPDYYETAGMSLILFALLLISLPGVLYILKMRLQRKHVM